MVLVEGAALFVRLREGVVLCFGVERVVEGCLSTVCGLFSLAGSWLRREEEVLVREGATLALSFSLVEEVVKWLRLEVTVRAF